MPTSFFNLKLVEASIQVLGKVSVPRAVFRDTSYNMYLGFDPAPFNKKRLEYFFQPFFIKRFFTTQLDRKAGTAV